jgi:hypothetical protein
MTTAPALDAATVLPVVRSLLADEGVVLRTWTASELKGGAGNPTTAGLFRVAGDAESRGRVRRWSVILKSLRNPTEFPGMHAPRHPLFWRREVEVYRSGLLEGLPGGLAAPACLGIDEIADGRVRLWLEDLGTMDSGVGDETQRRVAITHLARFHAAYLTGTPIPGYRWMTICFARQWYELLMPIAEPAIAAVRGVARHLTPIVDMLDDPSCLLDALESAPQTLNHHDTNPGNLHLRERETGGTELMVIDWQLIGRGPIGEDIGQFLSTIVADAEPARRERLESEVLAAYHVALGEAGFPLGLGDVHRGYYAAAALRQGVFALYLFAMELQAARTREDARRTTEDFVRRTRHGHLPTLATRALALTRS